MTVADAREEPTCQQDGEATKADPGFALRNPVASGKIIEFVSHNGSGYLMPGEESPPAQMFVFSERPIR